MDRDEARRVGRQLLGDRVQAALKTVGIHQIKTAVERATGWRCGCARRRAALNRWDAGRR
jgi:hypothetical protein